MQSASHTPSSHLRAQSGPADQRGVGHGGDRRANPGTTGRRQRPSPRGSRMPPRGITRDTRLSGAFGSPFGRGQGRDLSVRDAQVLGRWQLHQGVRKGAAAPVQRKVAHQRRTGEVVNLPEAMLQQDARGQM